MSHRVLKIKAANFVAIKSFAGHSGHCQPYYPSAITPGPLKNLHYLVRQLHLLAI
jgi:hypothetical protein